MVKLTIEQSRAINEFNNGKNLFITGPAGTGKSFLIKQMTKICREKKLSVSVCALTGCAAVQLNCKAKTIHSWGGLGIMNLNDDAIIRKIQNKRNLKFRWIGCDVLIIDEVSMMSERMFNLLDKIGREIRMDINCPFGGIQVVMLGDFLQLPPVCKLNNFEKDENPENNFCFESLNWNRFIEKEIILTEIHRQKDNNFKRILNDIRLGNIKEQDIELLKSRVNLTYTNPVNIHIKPPKIFPRRNDVDLVNRQELKKYAKNDGLTCEYFVVNKYEGRNENISKKINKEIKFRMENSIIEEKLILYVGVQVMCIVNLDLNNGICNGSIGIVTGIKPYPRVKFINGVEMLIKPYFWECEDYKDCGIKQFPLVLAFAQTIHKMQGLTLEIAEIDVGNRIFECGQTYVALSRCKTLDGLYLKNFNPDKIKVNPKVVNFYKRISKYPINN